MDIRDYANLADSIGTKENVKRVPVISVEYADTVDFVLSKKTKNTKKLLMVMPSKGVVAISDGNYTEEVTDKLLSDFFAGQQDLNLTVSPTVYMLSASGLKDAINKIRNLKYNECISILKFGILNDIPEVVTYNSYWGHDIPTTFVQNVMENMQPEIMKMRKENVVFSPTAFKNMFSTAMEIKKIFGLDIARYFLDCAIKSKITVSDCGNAIKEIFRPEYMLDPRRTIEYLCFEFPKQGILELSNGYNSSMSDYKDYLSMEFQMYRKVKEKYPKHLKTDHDITQMKFKLVEDKILERNFNDAASKYKDLAYSGDNYTIIIPERPADLVEEGRRLCHCVASYAKSVASGETMIVFCRRNSDLDNPHCTVEVKDGDVVQARCLHNHCPDDDTLKFIKTWAEKKNLNYRI